MNAKRDLIWPALGEILARLFPRLEPSATRDTPFTDIPGLDSLARINLALAVEKAFVVRFTAREIAALRTVGDLWSLIDKKKQNEG